MVYSQINQKQERLGVAVQSNNYSNYFGKNIVKYEINDLQSNENSVCAKMRNLSSNALHRNKIKQDMD